MAIRIKRVYEPPAASDGYRVLVDRLWPRGVSKEAARLDAWLKAVAPSDELRKWSHGPGRGRWQELRERYFAELSDRRAEVEELLARAREGDLTLLYAARDREHNNAVALLEYLEARL